MKKIDMNEVMCGLQKRKKDYKLKKHDIKILTPYYNIIESRTEHAIYKLLDDEDINCAWLTRVGTAIAYIRNALVNDLKSDLEYQKLEGGFTHYLFIDADTVVSVETVKQLLSYDLDIVSGAYVSRESEDYFVGGHFKYDDENNVVNFVNIEKTTKGLIDVDWVGAGCLLIKKEVFENLPYPWFHYPIMEKKVKDRIHRQLIFEDVGFSMLAKKHGYKIYLDCDVKVEHFARNYQRENTTNFDLLFKNVNDDVNKMCQLMRMMSYKIIDLEKQKGNK